MHASDSYDTPHRLVLLIGPSCAGKSPLVKAVRRLAPAAMDGIKPLVLYNDRAPRPGETDGVDYHFRTRDEIEALRGDARFLVFNVRKDLQAVDLQALRAQLAATSILFEGNAIVGKALLTDPRLDAVERLSVYLAPLSLAEIRFCREPAHRVDLPTMLTDMMRRKLLRRTRKQKGELALPDLEDIEARAGNAWNELQTAPLCRYVLPNHDGEDSEHWNAFPYPLGDAFAACQAFAALLRGATPAMAEVWPDDLFD